MYQESNRHFASLQHRFEEHFSSESQLLCLTNNHRNNMGSGYPIGAIFIDFAKVFDKVPHRLLLLKLETLYLESLVLRLITASVTNQSQFVYASGYLLSPSPAMSSVPQGVVPFLTFINDPPVPVTSIIRLFTNDRVMYHKITSVVDCSVLQSDLSNVPIWWQIRGMSLSINKCKSMHLYKLTLTLNTTLMNHC